MTIKFPKFFPLYIIIGIIIGIMLSGLFIFSYNPTLKTDSLNNVHIPNNSFSTPPNQIFQPYIPDTLYFCNERVPLEYFDVYEALDFELIANTYRHSSTLLYIKRANRFFPQIEKILAANNLPDDLKYLCVAESGLANVISPAGATGFWQFMKPTAIEYKLTVNKHVDERYDVEKSTFAAVKYLKDAYNKFGNWGLAAAAYNMGMGGLKKEIDYQKNNSYWDLWLNPETARYVYRILALKLIIQSPEKYGYVIDKKHLYQEIQVKKIKVDTTINDLVKFAIDNNTNYKMLKYFNPWLISTELNNNNNTEYYITIPDNKRRSSTTLN